MSLPFWSVPVEVVLAELGSNPGGLSSTDAAQKLARVEAGRKEPAPALRLLREFLRQFKSPITLTLLLAAGVSAGLRGFTDAAIILGIVLGSGTLGFFQEYRASSAVEKLLALVQVKVTVVRDGRETDIPTDGMVPGDIIGLKAGDLIPGDARILEAKDLFVDEGSLTGESLPVEKTPGLCGAETPLRSRTNVLFMGTHVISGTARALVARTGSGTEFGKVSAHLRGRRSTPEFERGLQQFGYFLMEVTLLLVIAIFAINAFLHRPILDSFLFALALAVGLTPQLLPAVVSVCLAHGAQAMAKEKVIVKRLAAIENFGSMDVLCSDKTGTLTTGRVHLHAALDTNGQPSESVMRDARLNAVHESGFRNPIDEAIRAAAGPEIGDFQKVDEVPYDFVRQRLSVLVARGPEHLLVTKGALPKLLDVCAGFRLEVDGADARARRREVEERLQSLAEAGFRVLGLARREMGGQSKVTREDETDLSFAGFLLFSDPPKPQTADALAGLRRMGVNLKIITGDHRLVAAAVSRQIGLANPRILGGLEVSRLSDDALRQAAENTDIFAEIEPNAKERIILALRRGGHVVGYLGDGINDASALHAADVGLSVEGAVDVAREAADLVLLEKDLHVLLKGMVEGRRTFANTLKYIFMATSANFGNMFSMAGASLFLPFLPLLPKQILLTNALTDLPEMVIPTDRVNTEALVAPHRWNLPFIRKFMLTFGFLSSLFDFAMFFALLVILRADEATFRTGWLVESVVSACLIALVIRTRQPCWKSAPSRALLFTTLAVVVFTLLFPFCPLARDFGFVPISGMVIGLAILVTCLYVLAVEGAKRIFYAKVRS